MRALSVFEVFALLLAGIGGSTPGSVAHREGVAFTTWLDFDLAAKQAKAIVTALTRKKPDLRETLQKNYKALERDLVLIDKNIKKIVSKHPSKPLIG